jgi:lipopolysaccharide biosynthesis glycosyltransferase
MQKDKIVFTVADERNMPYALILKNSFKHFHPDIEFRIYPPDLSVPDFFYKATPFIAKELIKTYPLVVKIDADSIITGSLDDVFSDTSYDLGIVLNNNRLEPQVTCLNIPPEIYANCGFVAMRSREAVDQWWEMCNRFYFNQFQFREQDILNMMIVYGNYNVANFDAFEKWYGLVSKSEWGRFEMHSGKLVCPADLTYNPTQKTVCCIHAAGGNTEKWNWSKQFKPEVVKYLHELTK